MTRVVEAAVVLFEDRVKVDKVVTRTPQGAQRYRHLVKTLGRPLAVPSIVINGQPAFDMTPGVEELQQILHQMTAGFK